MVNELSDSVSVVSLSLGVTVATLAADDEPADVVFAQDRAFVSCARNNLVRVFDAVTHRELATITLHGVQPRALAASPDGTKIFAAFQLSGNRTTTLPPALAPPPPAPAPVTSAAVKPSASAAPAPARSTPTPPAEPYDGIHRHGEDHAFARLVVEADLTSADKLIINLITLWPEQGKPAWGYAAGYRHAFSHALAAGLEAIGDFGDANEHEIVLGGYASPTHHLTFKLGAGLGLTEASPDFSVRTGVVWRF